MKLMFGWNVHTELYHILRIGQGLDPHPCYGKNAKKMYITLCPRENHNAIQYLDTNSWTYIYPNYSDPELTINTLCKDCFNLYKDKDEVLFKLIKIKLGAKG